MNYLSHHFYIPVMGVSFTIDTPAKVARYGISSVIPLADDKLLEQMREYYCQKYRLNFQPILDKAYDSRAKRITAYLNTIHEVVQLQMNELKSASFDSNKILNKYFELLPDDTILKKQYNDMKSCTDQLTKKQLENDLKKAIKEGRIDVNIMTKVDGLPEEKNKMTFIGDGNAHSALRGFANSVLNSAIIFSAGMNPRLYAYAETFEDFYPNEEGELKKEIILKVSDYRSALIQGAFLAKKGLWVSEFRVESGLNCGGHAFATEGYLMGPILEEFKSKRIQLLDELYNLYAVALSKKGKSIPEKDKLTMRIGAQGGIGTANEAGFLRKYYNVDATGWGTPFLLVPEATTVDDETLKLLAESKKEDLYLSDVSPLGVLINNIKGNAKDEEKMTRAGKGKPGSPCVKHFLKFNTEFTEKPICTASVKYQKLKIESVRNNNMNEDEARAEIEKVVNKVCLCEGLSASAILSNNLAAKGFSAKPFVCPGPNLAYFSRVFSLEEMVNHIYGKINILNNECRSNMFINELRMYVDYYFDKVITSDAVQNFKKINSFRNNLLEGIEYYKGLVDEMKQESIQFRKSMLLDLMNCRNRLVMVTEGI